MGLNKIRLGDYIKLIDRRNRDNIVKKVMGVSVSKKFREPTSKVNRDELKNYKIVAPGQFASVPTTHNEKCFAFAYNDTHEEIVVSSIDYVFEINDKSMIVPEWLKMYFSRYEFDRYARYNSWGTARETFDFEEIENVIIDLPDLDTQQKYVDIYKAMVANQQSYERGLEDLKLVCDGYIEDLRRKMPCEKIGKYITECTQRNEMGLSVEAVRGIATSKEFIDTKANMDGVSLNNYKIVQPSEIAFIADTSRRGDKMSLAMNASNEVYLVSAISTVFKTNPQKLLPKYLMLFFTRPEFDRYARFCSWGSARETFDWSEMCDVEIPIPDIKIQEAISELYTAYTTRREINEKLKAQIKDICPILIKGAMEEGRGEAQ